MDPENVSAVSEWPIPVNIRQVRRFLGMASWYRWFIRDFAATAAPLTALTRKNAKWNWGESENNAFEALKRTLTTVPVLACPDFGREFVLQTDVSSEGLEAVLTQDFLDGERVIAYASRSKRGRAELQRDQLQMPRGTVEDTPHAGLPRGLSFPRDHRPSVVEVDTAHSPLLVG